MKRLIFILTILTLAYAGEALAIQKRPRSLSPESLYKSAQAHFNNKEHEKALAEFTAVAEDYVDGESPEDADYALKANKMLWYLYEFVYFDHAKAYEAALRAQEIADATEAVDPEISFSLGSICQTLSEQGDDRELMDRAYEYFTRCFNEALECGDAKTEYLDMAVSNILSLGREFDRMRDIDGIWKRYVAARRGDTGSIYTFNKAYHEVTVLEHQGHYEKALAALDAQLRRMESGDDLRRYAAATYLLRSEVLENAGALCGEVTATLEKMLEVAQASNLKDGVLLANKLLWKRYASGPCADREKELAYRSGYLEMKDSILSYRQVAAMKEIGAQRQIGVVKREMDAVKQRYVVMTVVLIAVIALLAATFFFYWQLRRKNRELSFKNESLYQFAQRDIQDAPDNGLAEEVKEKYSTSGLTEADSERLARMIGEVFADPAEICNEEFSARRLAAILDTSYPYVSQVINTRYGCNFNAMLNRSRIREACRIMNDPAQARMLTIEGISHKVGFKSRTTFINSFKKATGMTPSEYLKVASARRENRADGMSDDA